MKHQQETCPHCGYPTLGSEGAVCPECGESLRVPQSQIRKRQWKAARTENQVVLGAVVAVAGLVCMFVVIRLGVSAAMAGLCAGMFTVWMTASLYTSFGCYVMPFLASVTYVLLLAVVTLSGASTRIADVYLGSICFPSVVGAAAGALLREGCFWMWRRGNVG